MAALESLLKQDHPVVVNENATKFSTKVSLTFFSLFNIVLIYNKNNLVCSFTE